MIIRICGFLCAAALLCACNSSLPDNRYFTRLPGLPAAWSGVLPPAHWRVEWREPSGRLETLEIAPGARAEISLPVRANAALAWPYWPEKGIVPGIFRPAGGLFPFDVEGNELSLSWRGGIEAFFYREMEKATAQYSGARLPSNFNWPRFRELFADTAVNAEFRADPWLADWPAIAENTGRLGFNKRRLVPRPRAQVSVPLMPGPWAGTSPFAAALHFTGIPAFPVAASDPAADIWVCTAGIVRCNRSAWIFSEWR